MKLPRKVVIKGVPYKIRITKSIEIHADGAETLGLCLTDKKELLYSEKVLKDPSLYHVVLHEIMHAVWYETGVDQRTSHDLEEIATYNTCTTFAELFSFKPKKS